jgi:hypothetical protein
MERWLVEGRVETARATSDLFASSEMEERCLFWVLIGLIDKVRPIFLIGLLSKIVCYSAFRLIVGFNRVSYVTFILSKNNKKDIKVFCDCHTCTKL